MRIGVPKEIKTHEYRVGLTPMATAELVQQGHQLFIQTGAGAGIDMTDEQYQAAGATIVADAPAVFKEAEMVVKVKEPQAAECKMLREGQILFTYLHLAPDPEQTDLLVQSGASVIAYETVQDADGRLPLLAPMSEVAGRLSIQMGATHLEKAKGGRGVLLGGVPGVAPGDVVVVGGGVAGANAAMMALGIGARVTILDKSIKRLQQLDQQFQGRATTICATSTAIAAAVREADLVIGAVLVPGASAPKVITREMVKQMRRGSVIVDISIDQGGCAETARPTSHDNPTYVEEGVVHYCVTNMPGAVARTSTMALNNVTLPYTILLANQGLPALKKDPGFMAGLNIYKGHITCEAVAQAQGKSWQNPHMLLT